MPEECVLTILPFWIPFSFPILDQSNVYLFIYLDYAPHAASCEHLTLWGILAFALALGSYLFICIPFSHHQSFFMIHELPTCLSTFLTGLRRSLPCLLYLCIRLLMYNWVTPAYCIFLPSTTNAKKQLKPPYTYAIPRTITSVQSSNALPCSPQLCRLP